MARAPDFDEDKLGGSLLDYWPAIYGECPPEIDDGSRGEWPLRQRGRPAGAVRLCDLDYEPCGRHGRWRLETLIGIYGPRAGLPDIRRGHAMRTSRVFMMPAGQAHPVEPVIVCEYGHGRRLMAGFIPAFRPSRHRTAL